MADYRELYRVSDLSNETNEGDGVKVAVIDTGIPPSNVITSYLSANKTPSSDGDPSGHATFIGSILFGKGDIHGICSNAMACFIKVFDHNTTKPDMVAQAIYHAVDSWRTNVINLSLGFSSSNPCPECVKKACDYAVQKNTVVVASSGNDGGAVLWPAALPDVFSVGSSTGSERSNFSNTGKVDFVVNGTDLEGYDTDGSIVKKTGTSFSTAVVTGMVALLIGLRHKNGLDVTVHAIKDDLASYCIDIGKPGYDEETGYGVPFGVVSAKPSLWLRITSAFDKIILRIGESVRGVIQRRNKL